VGGDDQQLSAITLRDACEFVQKYYVPERATVIIAGGIATDDAVRSIEKWFAAVPRRTPARRRGVEPFTVASTRSTVELDIERPWVTIAWALPDARTPEGEAAQLGIWSAFFDAARKADEYECATRGFSRISGGERGADLHDRARALQHEQAR
jgi:predicted Zn-dependent peptidase